MFTFDPDRFKATVINEPFETRVKPVPNGEYVGVIKDFVFGKQSEKGGVPMNVIWEIDNQALRESLSRKVVTSRQTVWLNFDEVGNLPRDQNQTLGRLRDALGQNGPEAWSPSMIIGKAGRIKVAQRIDEKTGEVYDDVVAVAKL